MASFRIRSGKKGLELRLHALEASVMDTVWTRHLSSFSVNDVLGALSEKRDIAYTTVMTTVTRLYEKGLLTRKREGKRYLYASKLTREQFLESTARDVLKEAVGEHRTIALLAERVSKASAEDLDGLERLIQKRREELGQ